MPHAESRHQRCEHLACGTYCSLDTSVANAEQRLLHKNALCEVKMGNILRKQRTQRDQQESFSFIASENAKKRVEHFSQESYREPSRPVVQPSKTTETEEECCETHLTPQELLDHLKENPKFLIEQLCYRLKKYDRYNRGIVLAKDFMQVIKTLGVTMPSPHLNDVLNCCIITPDGFVVYKPLHRIGLPNRSESSDRVRRHLCPPAIWQKDLYYAACPQKFLRCWVDSELYNNQSHAHQAPYKDVSVTRCETSFANDQRILSEYPDEPNRTQDDSTSSVPSISQQEVVLSCNFTSQKSDAVRRLFAMWDRCLIDDEKLKYHLKLLEIPITKEAETLIATYSASRTLPFNKFLQALHINVLCPYRKNRCNISLLPNTEYHVPSRHGLPKSECQKPVNPITWRSHPISFFLPATVEIDSLDMVPSKGSSSTEISKLLQNSFASTDTGKAAVAANDEPRPHHRTLLKLIADIKSNRIAPSVLRRKLESLGLVITSQIDRLLNQKEAGSDISYSKLVTAVSRAPSLTQVDHTY